MKQTGATSPNLRRVARTHAIWPVAVVACLSWIGIVVCIDPAGSYPQFPQGPGLTVDEIFNVEQGVYLIEQSRSLGWLNLIPGTSQAAFDPQYGYNPDHPPLGRYWLGIHHHLTWWLIPPADPEGIVVTACARTGSATAFALTIFLLGLLASSWSGPQVGAMTAISLVLMPRLFGHAHLASLETITNLTCTAAVLAVASRWNCSNPPTWRSRELCRSSAGTGPVDQNSGDSDPRSRDLLDALAMAIRRNEAARGVGAVGFVRLCRIMALFVV